MVDLADVPQMQALVGEKQSISMALDNLKQGGKIVAMEIAPPQPEQPEGAPPMPPPFGARVPTTEIDYPPQMVTGIEAAFEARLKEIADELAKLGVTMPEAEPAKAKK